MNIREAFSKFLGGEDETETTKKNVYQTRGKRKKKKKKGTRHGGYGGKKARKGYEEMLESADEY